MQGPARSDRDLPACILTSYSVLLVSVENIEGPVNMRIGMTGASLSGVHPPGVGATNLCSSFRKCRSLPGDFLDSRLSGIPKPVAGLYHVSRQSFLEDGSSRQRCAGRGDPADS